VLFRSGGASGLITAYFLQHAHDVVVFEKRAVLGGNIQTLNRNANAPNLPAGTYIENGVLGFHKQSYPLMHRLLAHLNVDISESRPTSALYANGELYPSNPKHLLAPSILAKLAAKKGYFARLNQMRKSYAHTFRKIGRHDKEEQIPLDAFLGTDETLNAFVRSLASLAFSTPYAQTTELSSHLVAPYLKATRHPEWTAIKGGVYSYVEALLDRKKFRVETSAGDVKIRRTATGVTISVKDEETPFDIAIIASTPGQTLNILEDATEHERNIFSSWSDRTFKTTAHMDMSIYKDLSRTQKTPMDLFAQHPSPESFGYNTYMNDFYGLPSKTPYAFAYNLDHHIQKDKILHTASHIVPTYTVPATKTLEAIHARNGENHTYFAGAYLGNGLHEGAAASAHTISTMLGGLKL